MRRGGKARGEVGGESMERGEEDGFREGGEVRQAWGEERSGGVERGCGVELVVCGGVEGDGRVGERSTGGKEIGAVEGLRRGEGGGGTIGEGTVLRRPGELLDLLSLR